MTSFTDLSMVNKLLLVFAFQCSFTASTLAGAPSFGFVDMQDGQLFLHTSTKLTDIGVVYLQYPGKSTRCCLQVRGKELTASEIESNVEAVEPEGAAVLHRYAVALTRQPTEVRPFIGMALINVKPPVVASNSFMRASTGHSTRYTIHKCIASEGVNLYGPKRHGVVEHLYYGLGYEIDLSAVRGETICPVLSSSVDQLKSADLDRFEKNAEACAHLAGEWDPETRTLIRACVY